MDNFQLRSDDPAAPRLITEADLDELLEWGPEQFVTQYPGATAEALLPLCRLACQGYPYRALRTDDAFAVFAVDRRAWEIKPVVFNLFGPGWRAPEKIHQAAVIVRSARAWARSIGASHLRLIECGANLAPLADRLGQHEITHTYEWPL